MTLDIVRPGGDVTNQWTGAYTDIDEEITSGTAGYGDKVSISDLSPDSAIYECSCGDFTGTAVITGLRLWVNGSQVGDPLHTLAKLYVNGVYTSTQVLDLKTGLHNNYWTPYDWVGDWRSGECNDLKINLLGPVIGASEIIQIDTMYVIPGFSAGMRGEYIDDIDVSGIIAQINTEENRRVMGLTDLTIFNEGDKIDYADQSGMVARVDLVNVHHCYCEADGTMESHQGGTTLSLWSADAVQGDSQTNLSWFDISGDMADLSGQCQCDSYTCQCEAWQQFTCTCHNVCTCFVQCSCLSDISIK